MFWLIVIALFVIGAIAVSAGKAATSKATLTAMAEVAGSEQTLRRQIAFLVRELGGQPVGADAEEALVRRFYPAYTQTANLLRSVDASNAKTLMPVIQAQADTLDRELTEAIGGEVEGRYRSMNAAQRAALGKKFNREMGLGQ